MVPLAVGKPPAGQLQKVPGMDFTNSAPQLYLLAAAGLLLLSVFWRGRQLRARN